MPAWPKISVFGKNQKLFHHAGENHKISYNIRWVNKIGQYGTVLMDDAYL